MIDTLVMTVLQLYKRNYCHLNDTLKGLRILKMLTVRSIRDKTNVWSVIQFIPYCC